MDNQFPTAFQTEQIVALYMVHSQKDTVSATDLSKFHDFLSNKFSEYDSKLPQNERFNCIFLFSDFYLRNLNADFPSAFSVSKIDKNGERQISCPPEFFANLKDAVLSHGLFQNPEFAKTADAFAQEYMEEQHNQKQPGKKLTQKQDDQRWWNTFGK